MHIIKPQESSIVEERNKFPAAGERNILVFLEIIWPIYFLCGKEKVDLYAQVCSYFTKERNINGF